MNLLASLIINDSQSLDYKTIDEVYKEETFLNINEEIEVA